jgi:uncharacterized phage protein (TIGR01671 family)
MREILFRGKEVESSDWYYGDIFHSSMNVDTTRIHDYINRANVEIIPDTLGQFTGLTDKNGTKIFEGDIVEYEGKRYSINYLPHYARFSAVKPNTVFCVFAYQRGEVIGNIYDNPELIGGGQNG